LFSGLIGMGLAAGLMALLGTQHGEGGFDPLNHDGVNDFLISHWFYGHADHLSEVQQAPANEIFDNAAALPAGVPIGPRGPFLNGALLVQNDSVSGISSFSDGPWKDVHHRYLGLKFSVNGETGANRSDAGHCRYSHRLRLRNHPQQANHRG
jgi:hypothetical protein